jgi:hypothetical protein
MPHRRVAIATSNDGITRSCVGAGSRTKYRRRTPFATSIQPSVRCTIRQPSVRS